MGNTETEWSQLRVYQNLFCLSAELLCHLQLRGNFCPPPPIYEFALDENTLS